MIGIIRDLYTEFRNFITLKFIYPIKHPRNDLKSIVPPNVANKLGIIVRKGVRSITIVLTLVIIFISVRTH